MRLLHTTRHVIHQESGFGPKDESKSCSRRDSMFSNVCFQRVRITCRATFPHTKPSLKHCHDGKERTIRDPAEPETVLKDSHQGGTG